MAHFDLSNYETVASRITRFWQDHPDGRIATEWLNSYGKEGGTKQFVVIASIFAHKDDDRPVSTGLAEEHFADRGPNETSPLENAETSAIGRALVNWKYSSTAETRPSREEMSKVNTHSQDNTPAPHRVSEVKEQIKSTSPKMDVESDSRWETILQGAQADPTNTFLNDLAEKGKKYKSLSDKQLGAGFNAARKVLQDKPSGGEPQIAKVAEAFGVTEEGWASGEEPF